MSLMNIAKHFADEEKARESLRNSDGRRVRRVRIVAWLAKLTKLEPKANATTHARKGGLWKCAPVRQVNCYSQCIFMGFAGASWP
jgi:hypothetical protein